MRPKPRAEDIVYVMKMSFFGVWLRGRVIEVTYPSTVGNYVSLFGVKSGWGKKTFQND